MPKVRFLMFSLFNGSLSPSKFIGYWKHAKTWCDVKPDALLLPVTDASGRYSSQFFFGNGFWLGSHTLCEELQLQDSNTEPPPFRAAFHVAKLQVSLTSRLTPAVSTVTTLHYVHH